MPDGNWSEATRSILFEAHANRVGALTQAFGPEGDIDDLDRAHDALRALLQRWDDEDRQAPIVLTDAQRTELRELAELAAAVAGGSPEQLAETISMTASRLTRLYSIASDLNRLQASADAGAEVVVRMLANDFLARLHPAAPEQAPENVSSPEWETLLAHALMRCAVIDPWQGKARQLGPPLAWSGLGRALRIREDSLPADDWWRYGPEILHPLDTYPLVPRRRVLGGPPFSNAHRDRMSSGIEGTGPLGWAFGDELLALATDVDALAAELRYQRDDLESADFLDPVGRRLRAIRARDNAVVGWLEVQPPEGRDPYRNLFVFE